MLSLHELESLLCCTITWILDFCPFRRTTYRLIFYINFSDENNIAFKPLASQYLFFHPSNDCTKCFYMTSNIQFARCIALGLLAVATPVCTKSIMFDTTGLQRRLLVQVICIFLYVIFIAFALSSVWQTTVVSFWQCFCLDRHVSYIRFAH
jgi:hypothetical protein